MQLLYTNLHKYLKTTCNIQKCVYNESQKTNLIEKRKRTMKKVLSLVLAAVMIITMAACMTACSSDDNKLTMATNAEFPPYEYREGKDGEIIGIDAEIAAEIAKKLGMELEIVDTEFGSIVGGVQSGKYDMGMAGLTVNEERKQSVNFSTSYATGVQVVIVKDGGSVASLEDLDGDVKIGVQQDTTGDIYASAEPKDGGYGADKVIRYKSGAEAVQALVTGKVQAVIIDNEPAKSFVKANEGLKILDTEYAVEDYAICVAKENNELLEKINKALAELKADGTIDKIVKKYIPAE